MPYKEEKHWNTRFQQHRQYHQEFHKEVHRRHRQDFYNYHKYLRIAHPMILIFNAVIIYLLFFWVGYKTIGIILAAFITIKEIIQLFFLWRLEKRIFQPIEKLNLGVREIARGNYDVSVETDVENEIGLLIDSFNEMARKLRDSEKLKQDYEENRKSLIANISHDLKTPMASIQGYIEAILDGTASSPEKLDNYLKIITHNTAYVNKLIDDLMMFSQLDMNKLDFCFEEIPFRAFMRDLMEEFQLELEERDSRLCYLDKLEADCPLRIDRKRFCQAMRNIIGNAVKYGPVKDLVIKIEVYRQDDFIKIAIEDNGPGIPADKLEHIFKRFYRIDSERTKDLMSTGLGLAIARELIEAHGGKIEAASTEGEGCCFTVSLPGHEDRSNADETDSGD